MRSLKLALLLCLIAWPAAAQVAISALPDATTPLSGPEFVPIVQGGTTKKAPASAFSFPGGSSGQLQYNLSGAFAGFTLGGDCTFSVPNVTCTKTGGVSFGTAATKNTGTSGATIPLLNGANTWSAAQAFTATPVVNLNAASPPSITSSVALQLVGADTASTQAFLEAFGNTPGFVGRRADTSGAAPSAVQSGDGLLALSGFGYGATGYSSASRAQINLAASENWTDAAQGADITFRTTANGTILRRDRWKVTNDGNLIADATTGGFFATKNYTAAALPSAVTAGVGARAFVTDATACKFGVALAGSGSVACPVYSDGVSWLPHSMLVDPTNASNTSSGTLAAARGGAGTITGALKGNGAGVVTQAACADLSDAAASCATNALNASNISSGTLAAARGGAGAVSGALKANGAGAVSQAACADLSDSAASCATNALNASNISSGTLSASRGGAGTVSGVLNADGSGNVSSLVPEKIPGNWYLPPFISVASGAAASANSIRCIPIIATLTSYTAKTMGVRITTSSGGGNVQVAIYANNAATGRPTGTALASTGSLSTASGTTVSAAPVGGNFTVPTSVVWECANFDNATAAIQAPGVGQTLGAAFIGSATQANIQSASSTASFSVSTAQTFGTWPDLTSVTWAEGSNSGTGVIALQAN